MPRFSKRFIPVLFASLVFGPLPPASAEEAPGQRSERSTRPRRDRPSAGDRRERWKKLPPEKRREIEKLFRQLRKLPPESRSLLMERLRSMDPDRRRKALRKARKNLEGDAVQRASEKERRRMIRKHIESLPSGERERFDRLSRDEKRKFLDARMAARRRAVLSSLAPHLREEAEQLPPREQARFLLEIRSHQVFKETFPDRGEVLAVRRLPRRDVLEALRVVRGVPPTKPDVLSEATWKRWLALKPYERLRVLRLLTPPPQNKKSSPGRKKRTGEVRNKPPSGSPRSEPRARRKSGS